MKNKITQKEFIIRKIIEKGSISRNFALSNYISRLGAIMCDIQKEGYLFDGEYVKVKTPFGFGRDYVYKIKDREALFQLELDYSYVLEKDI